MIRGPSCQEDGKGLFTDLIVSEALGFQSHLCDCPTARRSSQLATGGVWETLAPSTQKLLN